MSGQVVALVGALVGITVGLTTIGGMVLRRLTPVVSLAQQLHGEPGDELRGIAARPGILERQTATERLVAQQAGEIAALRADGAETQRKLDEALAQLRNNGGSSMKDVLDKTYAAVTASAQ